MTMNIPNIDNSLAETIILSFNALTLLDGLRSLWNDPRNGRIPIPTAALILAWPEKNVLGTVPPSGLYRPRLND